jgi:hypothetical protein
VPERELDQQFAFDEMADNVAIAEGFHILSMAEVEKKGRVYQPNFPW